MLARPFCFLLSLPALGAAGALGLGTAASHYAKSDTTTESKEPQADEVDFEEVDK